MVLLACCQSQAWVRGGGEWGLLQVDGRRKINAETLSLILMMFKMIKNFDSRHLRHLERNFPPSIPYETIFSYNLQMYSNSRIHLTTVSTTS